MTFAWPVVIIQPMKWFRRHKKAGPPRKDTCKRGHPLVGPEADVYLWRDRNGYLNRECRKCRSARREERKARETARA